jgi:hypothetical protein
MRKSITAGEKHMRQVCAASRRVGKHIAHVLRGGPFDGQGAAFAKTGYPAFNTLIFSCGGYTGRYNKDGNWQTLCEVTPDLPDRTRRY